MFEGDYCPNCDSYIKQLETENERLEAKLNKTRELIHRWQTSGDAVAESYGVQAAQVIFGIGVEGGE